MSPIYKTDWGVHLDLSKICSVETMEDVVPRIGYCLFVVIHFQLMDKPVAYQLDPPEEAENDPRPIGVVLHEAHSTSIEKLISTWKEYTDAHDLRT